MNKICVKDAGVKRDYNFSTNELYGFKQWIPKNWKHFV